MIHNTAKKAAKELPPVESVLVDVYYYFEKSSDRQRRFKGTQEFYDVEQRRMLKHVETRWLSIGRCLDRLVENWDPLKDFFRDEREIVKKSSHFSYQETKIETIFGFVRSPTNKLFVLFLSYTVKVFEEFLQAFQSEHPKIHLLRRGLQKLLRTVMMRFVKPSAFSSCALDDVDHRSPHNLKSNADVVIGEAARGFLAMKEENHLRDNKIAEFFSAIRKYFITLVDYLKKTLPLKDKLLVHAEVADFSQKQSCSAESLRYFLLKYPCLLEGNKRTDIIMEQFSLYQTMDFSSCQRDRMDETWRAIGKVTDEVTGAKLFDQLSEVMGGILCIPHSSAHCERVFSCVRKNETCQRSSMADDTLESLLVLKCKDPLERAKSMTDVELEALKSAYSKHLRERKAD